jgi:hypothetical protein
MRRVALSLALLLCLDTAHAAEAAREYFAANATGVITVGPDGSVQAVEITAPGLGQAVEDGFEATIRGWRFAPVLVDGQPATAKGHMDLSLLAQRAPGSEQTEVSIRNVCFVDSPGFAGNVSHDRNAHLQPPQYPRRALQQGLGAEVHLLLRIGEQGRVTDVATEKLFLKGMRVGQKNQQSRQAGEFQSAAEGAARTWTFADHAPGDTVRVPVQFVLGNRGWARIHPIAIAVPAWASPATLAADAPAELDASGQAVSDRLKLVTPLHDPFAGG